jgi:formamidopyrimidine-DNA glycosylase
MPELPEVEYARCLLERVAVGRRIVRIFCARDPIVCDGMSPARLRRALTGRRVLAARRRGKQLWLELDRRPWPLFHFGMTGSFRTPRDPSLRLASSRRTAGDDAWPPRFTKLRLFIDDGGELALTNKRRLGRIRLRQDPLREPPVSRLGFDPLLDLPPPGRFAELLRARSTVLKALLLDQTFAAGVGNWIADEVLYQAKIDPRRRANTLTSEEAKRLRRRLKSVVETAVRANAAAARLPRTWLFHRRWGRQQDAVTVKGESIEHITIAGRTTAWVPAVQTG